MGSLHCNRNRRRARRIPPDAGRKGRDAGLVGVLAPHGLGPQWAPPRCRSTAPSAASAARVHQRGVPRWCRHLLRARPGVINRGCCGVLCEERGGVGKGVAIFFQLSSADAAASSLGTPASKRKGRWTEWLGFPGEPAVAGFYLSRNGRKAVRSWTNG